VKPGNILVRNDGLVKLTDFGIAKAADAVPVTRSGMVMGTAHYIAPEQASGSEAGPAGDVYSLGIVGYECLAGHRPFRAESAVAVAMMQVRELPPPLPATVPLRARELIEAVLVKDPTLRYGTGGELALAVAAVRRGEPLPEPISVSGEMPLTTTRSPATPSRPRPAVGGAARRPAAKPSQERRPRTPSGAMRRTAQERPVPAPAARTEPLRLQPKARTGRTLLLVLFVLLTMAAVLVGVFLVRSPRTDGRQSPDPVPLGSSTGTVSSREGVLAGPAVSDHTLVSKIVR
jgi:serine/threonine-protein kinase